MVELAESETSEIPAEDGNQTDLAIDTVESGQEQETDGPDVVIELDEEEGSHPEPTKERTGIRKRIDKLTRKAQEANNEKAEALSVAAKKDQEIEILRQALAQKEGRTEVLTPPNPDDFDDGEFDPKYKQAMEAYTDKRIERKASEIVSKANETASIESRRQAKSEKQTRKMERHYEEAEKLGAKDYEETEDAALDVLGTEAVSAVVSATEKSPQILYYLGKNPSVANRIAGYLNKDNPEDLMQFFVEIGRLEAKLKVKPRTTIAPDPDEPLEGATPSGREAWDRRLEKARAKADMKGIAAIKKEGKAAGFI